MQRSVHVALKAAARKSKKEWTFVCDGTVLGRADPRYVSRRRGAIASHDPLQDEDGYQCGMCLAVLRIRVPRNYVWAPGNIFVLSIRTRYTKSFWAPR